jgi:DNA-3-methyladenine glycosylase II
VLSQRVRITQAARLRDDLLDGDGAFPAPRQLRSFDAELPGRKAEYLRAVAEAALDGVFTGLRELTAEEAVERVRQVKGLGPFAAELVVLRGANHPDGVPRHESRVEAEVSFRYGPDATVEQVSETWRPYRTWAVLHLRALRERRTAEIGG